ncbi:exodeoxyribonuclease VII small subunit [Trichothermofontia sp.]
MASKSAKSPAAEAEAVPVEPWTYEGAVAQVEAIVNRIESGELDLVDVFTEFAIAVKQLQRCQDFLEQKQQEVDLLIETLETP